ncbi:MAG: pyridoxal 5'-phosphate synthase glutaminase subunit PdxT [Clostridia bacterium]|nr:pyridoxal 5'-phosphate synthase glutaminase subunit PdxT [Clostridia bacterium]
MKIGVLAMQGAFREHGKALESCGCGPVEVRKAEHLEGLAGLILPGGESTAIGKLLVDFGLLDKIQALGRKGFPIFGTCAGLILLAKDIVGSNQPRLGLMDITAKRNAYGRQVDSFEIDLPVPEIGDNPIRAVFIRAPYIEKVGPEVKVLASFQEKVILARQGNLLAAAFHPELTEDFRLHKYFVNMCHDYIHS